jgi:hypothetical protein
VYQLTEIYKMKHYINVHLFDNCNNLIYRLMGNSRIRYLEMSLQILSTVLINGQTSI